MRWQLHTDLLLPLLRPWLDPLLPLSCSRYRRPLMGILGANSTLLLLGRSFPLSFDRHEGKLGSRLVDEVQPTPRRMACPPLSPGRSYHAMCASCGARGCATLTQDLAFFVLHIQRLGLEHEVRLVAQRRRVPRRLRHELSSRWPHRSHQGNACCWPRTREGASVHLVHTRLPKCRTSTTLVCIHWRAWGTRQGQDLLEVRRLPLAVTPSLILRLRGMYLILLADDLDVLDRRELVVRAAAEGLLDMTMSRPTKRRRS